MRRGVRISILAIAAVLALGITALKAGAEDYRHHEAHEHGVAHLNVAVGANDLYIEFFSPAANIVGFEHYPATIEQKQAVEAAKKMLEAGDVLFELPPAAQARLVDAMADTDIGKESGREPEPGPSATTDSPQKKEDNHGKDNHLADEHANERHSDFTANYHFVCKKPQKLTYMDVMLLHNFPGIEHVEVQIVTGSKQSAQVLTAKENRIVF